MREDGSTVTEPVTKVPQGFFRMTKWVADDRETFPRWRAHFDARWIATVLVQVTIEGVTLRALYRDGHESQSREGERDRKKRRGE